LVRYIVRGGWVGVGIGDKFGMGMVLHVYIAGSFEEAGLDSKSVAGILLYHSGRLGKGSGASFNVALCISRIDQYTRTTLTCKYLAKERAFYEPSKCFMPNFIGYGIISLYMFRPHAHAQASKVLTQPVFSNATCNGGYPRMKKSMVKKESRVVHLVLLVAGACSMHARQRRPISSVPWLHRDALILQNKFSVVK
jgi:hypothetical protein